MRTKYHAGWIRPGESPILVALFILVLCLFCMMLWCANLSVEACYVHPQYGKICAVRVDGHWYIRADFGPDLSEEAKVEIVRWIKTKENSP